MLEEAVRLDEANPEGHATFARLLAATGRIDEAAVSFRQAIALDPTADDIRAEFTRFLLQQGTIEHS